ncbi:MAG TPA: AraC family transcriptional regulator [Pseudonocardiaceae bacterium]|nr:AraC family transcriptional regulator [Pseudonocardiaceae bacterium]
MDEILVRAVERAIETMRQRFAEKVTIDDLARSAIFSKFYFSRIFQQVTGVSPGRFLSAIRLEEAKRLLLSTSWTVADISYQVGYNSVGTFSSRFHSSVGVSPITYRQLGRAPTEPPTDDQHLVRTPVSAVCGHVSAPLTGTLRPIFVGLFPDRILRGSPARYVMLDQPGPYMLPNAPPGTWHLMAHSVPTDTHEDTGQIPLIGSHGPSTLRPGITARLPEVHLRPMRTIDPPVLLALLDVRPTAPHQTTEQVRSAV